MGLIKRALRRTSRKLLSKLIPPSVASGGSHQLVLNPSASSPDSQALEHEPMSRRKLASLQRKLARKARASKDTAVAEALLLAVKNHLPPLQFHHVHGPHAQLGSNKCVARRTQSFCQALVFSNRVILPNERIYIKVLEISKCWSGTIRFGFTAVDPATLACRVPKHACPDMTNAGHTWARALADDVVRRNSVIHFSYNKHGIIHYGINNQDCGIFHANVSTSQNLWFIVDIYGLTAAVELIDPRVNSAAGQDLSETRTMYKSTSAMDELFGLGYANAGGAQVPRLRQKKQSRKQARQVAALIQAASDAQWPLENHLRSSHTFHHLGFGHPRGDYHQQQQQQHPNSMQLPNLNSISLPSAEQNIYTPMPTAATARSQQTQRRNAENDYHQIVNTYSNSLYQPIRATTSMANINNASSSFANTSSSNGTTTSINQLDLSHQMEQMNLYGHQQRKSTSVASQQQQSTPVAATRRRQQASGSSSSRNRDDKSIAHPRHIVSSNTNKSTSSSSSSSTSTPSASATKKATSSSAAATTTIVKPKTRHSTGKNNNSNNNKSTILATRDINDNNGQQPSKADCPICFERPINCVLYQCGHMCTCYECGVRQWKTGSRTCPICRAVIKDVIKTYKS